MADERDKNEVEEMNEENDAREEDIVEDEDADTRDVEETERETDDDIERRFSIIEEKLDRMLGEISSLREAQGIMVENGAVIQEPESELNLLDEDGFIPPKELDLLI